MSNIVLTGPKPLRHLEQTLTAKLSELFVKTHHTIFIVNDDALFPFVKDFAEEYNVKIKIFEKNSSLEPSAFDIITREMIRECDYVIAFIDDKTNWRTSAIIVTAIAFRKPFERKKLLQG